MLCNQCAANLRDGSWEVLMSSFVLGRIQVCADLCRIVRVPLVKALQHQRSPDLSQTESICGSFGESVACFAQAARTVENEVLHAIAGSERFYVVDCCYF